MASKLFRKPSARRLPAADDNLWKAKAMRVEGPDTCESGTSWGESGSCSFIEPVDAFSIVPNGSTRVHKLTLKKELVVA